MKGVKQTIVSFEGGLISLVPHPSVAYDVVLGSFSMKIIIILSSFITFKSIVSNTDIIIL